MLIWITSAGGMLGVEEGVIRAADVQEARALYELRQQYVQDGERLVEAAREKAGSDLQAARDEADRMLRDARTDAEAARAKGYDEGMTAALREWHDRQAAATIDKQRRVRELHGKLAQIVTSAVERIVRTQDRSSLYQRALKNVQSLTRGATSLKLRVGPHDYEQASASIASVSGLGDGGLEVEVVSDATLRQGSCIFESDLGVLDASLQTQLDSLRAAMERAVRRATAEANQSVETCQESVSVGAFTPCEDVRPTQQGLA